MNKIIYKTKRICKVCGKEFIIKHPPQECCSIKCSALAHKKWMKEYSKIYNQSNKAKRSRKKYKQSPEGKKAIKRYNQSPKGREMQRKWYLKHKYGITLEQKNKIYEKQNGKCLICKIKMLNKNDIHIDHNHKTGKIRGLLCGNCNRGIGLFKENPKILLNAIKYIKKE